MTPSHHLDISEEEKDERRRYGGLVTYQHEKFWGSFPGNYAWLCRLDNLEKTVGNFCPSEMKYLNFYRSSEMPELHDSASNALDGGLKFHSVAHTAKKAWFEEPQSPVTGMGQTVLSSFSAPFVTSGRKRSTDSLSNKTKVQNPRTANPTKQVYNSHCFLPAASQEELRLVHVDFVSGFLIAYYGQLGGGIARDQMCTVGMAVYCLDSRNYYYMR